LVLATCEIPVSVGQFGYRYDSCELVALGYSWVTEVQYHCLGICAFFSASEPVIKPFLL
jgi:hypothetical protein